MDYVYDPPRAAISVDSEGTVNDQSQHETLGDQSSIAVPVPAQMMKIDSAQLRSIAIGTAIILGLLSLLYWQFFTSQLRHAFKHQADWGHTLVIPFIAGYFVYLKREKLLAVPFKTAWIGLVPIILGSGWYMFCWLGPQTIRHHNLQAAGIATALFGILLLFCGFRAMKYLWFPLLYLCVFGQTISKELMQYVTYPMQDITAFGSHYFLNLITIDNDRSGNLLRIWNDGEMISLNIAEACSGMRMLMAFMALGVAMAYTGLKHAWQQVVLVLLGIPTAIVVNILRVATIAILSLFDTNFAAGEFHKFIGMLWLIPAFIMYMGIMWILKKLVVEEEIAD